MNEENQNERTSPVKWTATQLLMPTGYTLFFFFFLQKMIKIRLNPFELPSTRTGLKSSHMEMKI